MAAPRLVAFTGPALAAAFLIAGCRVEVNNRHEETTVYTRTEAPTLCGRLSEFTGQLSVLKHFFELGTRGDAAHDLDAACAQMPQASAALSQLTTEVRQLKVAAPADQSALLAVALTRLEGLRRQHDLACAPGPLPARQTAARTFARSAESLLGNEYAAVVRAGCVTQAVTGGTQAPARAGESQTDHSGPKPIEGRPSDSKVEPPDPEPTPSGLPGSVRAI